MIREFLQGYLDSFNKFRKDLDQDKSDLSIETFWDYICQREVVLIKDTHDIRVEPGDAAIVFRSLDKTLPSTCDLHVVEVTLYLSDEKKKMDSVNPKIDPSVPVFSNNITTSGGMATTLAFALMPENLDLLDEISSQFQEFLTDDPRMQVVSSDPVRAVPSSEPSSEPVSRNPHAEVLKDLTKDTPYFDESIIFNTLTRKM